MKISIIVPTLNEEQALPATLQNIANCAPSCEVIVVDGGSTDRTRDAVQAFTAMPILWLDAPKGRGNQMNAGAARASGDVLLFLHADTHLPLHAPTLKENTLRTPHLLGGFFRIAFVPRATR